MLSAYPDRFSVKGLREKKRLAAHPARTPTIVLHYKRAGQGYAEALAERKTFADESCIDEQFEHRQGEAQKGRMRSTQRGKDHDDG